VLAQDAIKHRGEARTLRATGAHSPAEPTASIQRILSPADIVIPGHDAALSIADGQVVAGILREEVTVTLDDRMIVLEV
jgi:hypothetical protein